MDKNSNIEKVERVGEKKFIATHDDGSEFHGEVKNPEYIKPFFDTVSKKRPTDKSSFGGMDFSRGKKLERLTRLYGKDQAKELVDVI